MGSPDTLLQTPYALDATPTSYGLGDISLDMGQPDALSDGPEGMSSAALMSMLNDGSFDMNALFNTEFAATPGPNPQAQLSNGASQQQQSGASGGGGSGFNGAFLSGNSMLGIVSSP